MNYSNKKISVAYLARGADKDFLLSCERFINSYKNITAGIEHSLHVIFKGFQDKKALEIAMALFDNVDFEPIFLKDDSFDIGAYIEWANINNSDYICLLNTGSEILAHDWLMKLWVNISLPNIGLVGSTGSYESLNSINHKFDKFPNMHIRTTGFMIDRIYFCKITEGLNVGHKFDAYSFESGPKSLTRKVLNDGKGLLLVGSNGRGYSPEYWPVSNTFRQGAQKNLMIIDNQSRIFFDSTWQEKSIVVNRTWGKYISSEIN